MSTFGKPLDSCSTRPHVAVQEHLARLVEDAQVHGACVQVDAAGVSVLLGVESHKGLLDEGFSRFQSLPLE